MFDVFEQYATDEKKEVEGVVVKLDDTAWIKVAREGNDNYIRVLSAKVAQHRDVLDLGTPEAEELDRRIVLETQAETLLTDFGGISYKGKSLKYSPANALKLMEIKDFRRRVVAESRKFNRYKLEQEQEQEKN